MIKNKSRNNDHYYYFGDTGGHWGALAATLTSIGVDIENHIVPKNVHLVHVGDVIHKGDTSSEALYNYGELKRKNPDQVTFLKGNHEYYHLGGINSWLASCQCTPEDIKYLQALEADGMLQNAHLLSEDFVVTDTNLPERKKAFSHYNRELPTITTHAGVSLSWLTRIGHHPRDSAEDVVQTLNETTASELAKGGVLLDMWGQVASPIWSIAAFEVWRTWTETPFDLPYNLVAGHTFPFLWKEKRWRGNCYLEYKKKTSVIEDSRIVVTQITKKGGAIVNIDPGYEKETEVDPQPYLRLSGHFRSVNGR